jgi:hypothetical protein
LKLAAFVRERWPPIKLLVTSGHVLVEECDLPPGGRFFKKPYQGKSIAQAITAMIHV